MPRPAGADKPVMEAAELPTPPVAAATPAAEPRLPLGELLVHGAGLSRQHLQEALAAQQAGPAKRIGELLVEHGFTTSKSVAQALAHQHGLQFVDLARVEVEPAATSLLTEQFARRAQVLPVRFLAENTVLVAIADPTNVTTADDLRLALGLNIKLAVADAAALEGTIERTYRVHIEVRHDGDDSELAQLHDVRGADGTANASELVNSLLSKAIAEGASDIHFDPQERELIVRARIDGVLRRMAEVPKTLEPSVTGRLKIMGLIDIAEQGTPQDGTFAIRYGDRPVDVRIAVVPTKHGEHVVLRLLHRSVKLELPDLGMSPETERLFLHAVPQPFGCVLACGPTGSGKTTTLYAALDRLNEEGRAITTVEDPVEYQLPGVNQMEVNAKIGLTFARGLRTILRSDPDVLLIGEVRDEETAKIAIQAAMTGHLVLTTLHTNDAASAIARLQSMGVEPALLASSVNCVVAQRLARRLCVHCREPYTPDEAELRSVGLAPGEQPLTLHRATGCLQCAGTGYQGRVAVYEVLPIEGPMRRLLESSVEEVHAAAVAAGMTTIRQDGLRFCLAGVTSIEEVRRIVGDRL